MAPLPQRLPLLAPVALQILELDESLQRMAKFHCSNPDLDFLRAADATIIAYMFFNRRECGACALRGDIVVDISLISLLLRTQKHLKQENVPKRRCGTRSEQNTPFPLPFP